jgi:hypothetical protein
MMSEFAIKSSRVSIYLPQQRFNAMVAAANRDKTAVVRNHC